MPKNSFSSEKSSSLAGSNVGARPEVLVDYKLKLNVKVCNTLHAKWYSEFTAIKTSKQLTHIVDKHDKGYTKIKRICAESIEFMQTRSSLCKLNQIYADSIDMIEFMHSINLIEFKQTHLTWSNLCKRDWRDRIHANSIDMIEFMQTQI